MPNLPFSSAYLKIERANEHIENLESEMRDFAASEAYSLRLNRTSESRRYVLEFSITQAVPLRFSVLIGDALHNLRSALDLAICEIERDHRGSISDRTGFPVRKSREILEAAINGGLKQKVPARIVRLIVETIQPYETGDGKSIWCLHELEILDKHRLLIPHMQIQGIFGICLKGDGGREIKVAPWVVTRTRNAQQNFVGDNLKIADHGHLGIAIFFEQGLPMGGESILPTLRQFSELVRSAIDLIRAEYRIG